MSAAQPSFTPEFAVTFRDMVVNAMRSNANTTAKVISAIPEGRRDYRPDPKAKSAYELAWHLACSEVWFLEGISQGSFAGMAEKSKNEAQLRPGSIGEIVNWYNKNLNAALDAVAKLGPAQLTKVLDFFGAFQFPAFMYLNFATHHAIHHRGQLSSYLRPMGSKVPSIYGGSADEPFQPGS